MHPAAIQAFLNLDSVVGVALIEENTLPYLYLKQEALNDQQRHTLICSLKQMMESTPDGLQAFEFNVMDYYAYAHQLKSQITFIILAQQPDIAIKLLTVQQLALIPEDMVASCIDFFKQQPNPDSMEALVQNLNQLSQDVSKYLGPQLTANYWSASQPQYEWLKSFEIGPGATISFAGDPHMLASAVHHLCIRQWTNAFMGECSKIIQDLPQKIQQCRGERRPLSIVPIGSLNKLAQFSPENSLFGN